MSRRRKFGYVEGTGPSLDAFQQYALRFKFVEAQVRACWLFYQNLGWRFPNGDPIPENKWLTILSAWERKDLAKRIAANEP